MPQCLFGCGVLLSLCSSVATSLRRFHFTTIQTPFVFLNRSICAASTPSLVAQDDDVSSRFTAPGFITAGCDWDCFQPITAATGMGLVSAPVHPLAILKTSGKGGLQPSFPVL